MADPTTKQYFTCLEYLVSQNKEFVGMGDWVSRDPNHTQTSICELLGVRDGLREAINYHHVFTIAKMLEPEEPLKEGEFEDGA